MSPAPSQRNAMDGFAGSVPVVGVGADTGADCCGRAPPDALLIPPPAPFVTGAPAAPVALDVLEGALLLADAGAPADGDFVAIGAAVVAACVDVDFA